MKREIKAMSENDLRVTLAATLETQTALRAELASLRLRETASEARIKQMRINLDQHMSEIQRMKRTGTCSGCFERLRQIELAKAKGKVDE